MLLFAIALVVTFAATIGAALLISIDRATSLADHVSTDLIFSRKPRG